MVSQQFDGSLLEDPFFTSCSGKRYSGRIVVVGNSEMHENRSELVDSADCVMRFSKVLHFGTGLCGTKTDILALSASKPFIHDEETNTLCPERLREKYLSGINLKPWHDCKEVWISGKYLSYEVDIDPYFKFFPALENKPRRLVHITPLFDFSFGNYKGQHGPITNGVAMVLYLLSIRALQNWTIQLVGFKNFRVRPGDISNVHDVSKDKKLLEELARMGYIQLCD